MADRADPNAKTIIYVGIVGTVAVFLIVILLQIVFYQTQEMETYRKVVSQDPEELTQLVSQQQTELNTYGWVDEANGIARVPIYRAMELTVQDIEAARKLHAELEEQARKQAFEESGLLVHLLGTVGEGTVYVDGEEPYVEAVGEALEERDAVQLRVVGEPGEEAP